MGCERTESFLQRHIPLGFFRCGCILGNGRYLDIFEVYREASHFVDSAGVGLVERVPQAPVLVAVGRNPVVDRQC